MIMVWMSDLAHSDDSDDGAGIAPDHRHLIAPTVMG